MLKRKMERRIFTKMEVQLHEENATLAAEKIAADRERMSLEKPYWLHLTHPQQPILVLQGHRTQQSGGLQRGLGLDGIERDRGEAFFLGKFAVANETVVPWVDDFDF